MTIEKNSWMTCKICQRDIREFKKKYGGANIYFSQVFKRHLETDHQLSIEQYFNITELCPCGICNKKLGIGMKGANFYIKKYACGRNPGMIAWSEKARTSRLGSNNPMYKKRPWNKDLTSKNNIILQKIAKKLTGKRHSEETKQKQSASAKVRKVHGHTGHKHSESTKQKLRENTLKMINEGRYKHTQTKPHMHFKSLLDLIKISYQEEKIVGSWAFDFYLDQYNLYIEIDGDYFHSNPKIYPKGPKSKTQKINAYRDIQKNNFCKNNDIELIRLWESDILNMNKKELICKLKELSQ